MMVYDGFDGRIEYKLRSYTIVIYIVYDGKRSFTTSYTVVYSRRNARPGIISLLDNKFDVKYDSIEQRGERLLFRSIAVQNMNTNSDRTYSLQKRVLL
jgi:hypothetical protein